MPVGSFPGINNFAKRTIRAADNPLDRCTVVSIFPIELDEKKHTIQPGRFIIPAGTYEKPSILVVGPSSWWKELEDDQPLLEITNSSIQVAHSIVNDYCSGLMCWNGADITPGLFFIPGEKSLAEVRSIHKSLLDKYRDNQNRWYAELIKIADSLWSRSNGNPLAISDIMRLAARALDQNTKEWLQDFQQTETVRCVACGVLRNPLYPICANCKTNVPEFMVNSEMIKAGKATKVG
jgi:hypothetical protein